MSATENGGTPPEDNEKHEEEPSKSEAADKNTDESLPDKSAEDALKSLTEDKNSEESSLDTTLSPEQSPRETTPSPQPPTTSSQQPEAVATSPTAENGPTTAVATKRNRGRPRKNPRGAGRPKGSLNSVKKATQAPMETPKKITRKRRCVTMDTTQKKEDGENKKVADIQGATIEKDVSTGTKLSGKEKKKKKKKTKKRGQESDVDSDGWTFSPVNKKQNRDDHDDDAPPPAAAAPSTDSCELRNLAISM